MACLQDPSKSQTSKRKRVAHTSNGRFDGSSSSHNPDDAPKLFSRSPSERVQLSLAGLSDTEDDQTQGVRRFLHRALAAEQKQERSDDDGSENESLKRKRRAPAATGPGKHFDTLLRSIHQLLDRGDIIRAKKTFGLLLQLRPGSEPFDIRQHDLWAIGAEILMRAGERPSRSQNTHDCPAEGPGDEEQEYPRHTPLPDNDFSIPAKWGSSANINNVKAYFETLIQQHPYNHRFPNSISALDFQLAMLSCEIYNAHDEYASGVAKAEVRAATWDGRCSMLKPGETASGSHGAESSLPLGRAEYSEEQAIAEARMQALKTMEDITKRMTSLMMEPHFNKNNDFLRLYITALLSMTDLSEVTTEMTPIERQGTENSRQQHRRAASGALEKLVHNGGELDGATKAWLVALSGEGHKSPTLLHSSIPIR